MPQQNRALSLWPSDSTPDRSMEKNGKNGRLVIVKEKQPKVRQVVRIARIL